MTRHVLSRPQSKRRVFITPEIEDRVRALLGTQSQNEIARSLGISQAAVWRIARRRRAEAARMSLSLAKEISR